MTKKILSSILVCSLILSGLPYALAWNNDYSSDSYSDSYYQKWDDYKYSNQQNSWRQNYDQNLNNNWNPPTVKTPATIPQNYQGESRPGGDIQVAQAVQPNVQIFQPQLSSMQESRAVTTNPQIYSEESRFSGKVETVDPSAALEANQPDINKFSSINTESLLSNSLNTPIRPQAVDNQPSSGRAGAQVRAGMSDEAFISQAKLTVPAALPADDKPIQQKVYLDNSKDYQFIRQTHTPIAPGAGIIYQKYEYANKQTGESKTINIPTADEAKPAQVEAKIKEQSQNLEGQVKAITPLVVKQGRSNVIPAGPIDIASHNGVVKLYQPNLFQSTRNFAIDFAGELNSEVSSKGWLSTINDGSLWIQDKTAGLAENCVAGQNWSKGGQATAGYAYGIVEGLVDVIGRQAPVFLGSLPKLTQQLTTDFNGTLKSIVKAAGMSWESVKTSIDEVVSGKVTSFEGGRRIGRALGQVVGFELAAQGTVLVLNKTGVTAAVAEVGGQLAQTKAGKAIGVVAEKVNNSALGKAAQKTSDALSKPIGLDGHFTLIRTISSEEANAAYVKFGNRPPYTSGTKVQEIALQKETTFVRLHGEANQMGDWVVQPKDIKGLTPVQIKDKFALPEMPTQTSEVTIPAGTKIRVGEVAPQNGWGGGGGTQYEIINPKLTQFSYRNIKTLRIDE